MLQAKAKDKSLKKTPLMSTSRRTPATTISMLRPCTSTKRKDDKSPLNVPAKRRLIHSEKARPTVCTSRVRRSGRVRMTLIIMRNIRFLYKFKILSTAKNAWLVHDSNRQFKQSCSRLEPR